MSHSALCGLEYLTFEMESAEVEECRDLGWESFELAALAMELIPYKATLCIVTKCYLNKSYIEYMGEVCDCNGLAFEHTPRCVDLLPFELLR